jgi:hypothetical protein
MSKNTMQSMNNIDWTLAVLDYNVISNTLHGIGFQQVISDSTHIEGSLLDHIYTNIEPQSQFIHPVYFSDHDAT